MRTGRIPERVPHDHIHVIMRDLEWKNMGLKMDGRQLRHLHLADDIVLTTSNISQAEQMFVMFLLLFYHLFVNIIILYKQHRC